MKYYLFLFSMLMGCGESREEIVAHNTKHLTDELRKTQVEVRVGLSFIDPDNPPVVIIDSCEYIQYRVYQCYAITHKGNCKNHSLQRDWMRELSEKQNKEVGK